MAPQIAQHPGWRHLAILTEHAVSDWDYDEVIAEAKWDAEDEAAPYRPDPGRLS